MYIVHANMWAKHLTANTHYKKKLYYLRTHIVLILNYQISEEVKLFLIMICHIKINLMIIIYSNNVVTFFFFNAMLIAREKLHFASLYWLCSCILYWKNTACKCIMQYATKSCPDHNFVMPGQVQGHSLKIKQLENCLIFLSRSYISFFYENILIWLTTVLTIMRVCVIYNNQACCLKVKVTLTQT